MTIVSITLTFAPCPILCRQLELLSFLRSYLFRFTRPTCAAFCSSFLNFICLYGYKLCSTSLGIKWPLNTYRYRFRKYIFYLFYSEISLNIWSAQPPNSKIYEILIAFDICSLKAVIFNCQRSLLISIGFFFIGSDFSPTLVFLFPNFFPISPLTFLSCSHADLLNSHFLIY